jgi:hypothetical protein
MTSFSAAARLGALGALVLGLGSVGCASATKVTQGPGYALSHPDYWKVKSVATKDGEPTIVNIGTYSNTVVNEGVGADLSAGYEASQAEVEARIYKWTQEEKAPDPTKKVAGLLIQDPDLKLQEHAQVSEQANECGADFKRKYTVLKHDETPMDLLKRPGFRTILVGTQQDNVLLGVVSRVPYEQDTGLYCHNLSNMKTQLQTLLDNLVLTAPAAGASPPAPPAAAAPAATPAEPSAAAPAAPAAPAQ